MSTFVETIHGHIFETDHPEWHKDCKPLTKKEGIRKRQEFAIKQLREILSVGDTVYTVLRHVSASGMSRRIDLYTMKDNKPRFLTGYAAHALGLKWGDKAGIVVGGCGMDMGFHLVYTLSRTIFPNGFNDGKDSQRDGGYALRHEWL
jgi:hypothetical protein